ncbi:MAG: PEP-CTERM sorting domain-containing protein [Planctomycetales bacterium]|nr:PEP-CTERM sorting domain-containing protein [Planctomycetales bacterium]
MIDTASPKLKSSTCVMCAVAVRVAIACSSAWSSGGVESFTGRGPFESIDGQLDGLDLVGWTYSGDGYLDATGLHVTNGGFPSPEGADQDFLFRIDDLENFSSSVVIENVDLGEADFLDTSIIGISHAYHGTVSGQIGGLRAVLAENERSGPNEWLFSIIVTTNLGDTDFVSVLVPSGDDIGLTLSVVADDNIAFAEFYDTVGSDEPTAVLGPIQLPPFAETIEYTSRVYMQASGVTLSNGAITRYSSLSLDAWNGDINGDGVLGIADVNLLSQAIWDAWKEPQFDVNEDGATNAEDLEYWVHDLRNTWFGDADVNGEFNSPDLVNLFQIGQYEDGSERNSTWSTGDWNADGDFTSADLVLAFQDGGYEQGPRPSVSAVPEPSTALLFVLAAMMSVSTTRWNRV